MNARIRKKHERWRLRPREMGVLTVDEMGRAIPRLLQRLRSRNEVWFVIDHKRPDRHGAMLSMRFLTAVGRAKISLVPHRHG